MGVAEDEGFLDRWGTVLECDFSPDMSNEEKKKVMWDLLKQPKDIFAAADCLDLSLKNSNITDILIRSGEFHAQCFERGHKFVFWNVF